MGGRVDDIAVVESNPSIIYVGFATGGIWKTTNNGTTWTPIFDEYPVSSIGDIAIAPSNPDVIYVGTGEPNNRQSSSFGAGVYKSTDGGKTFEYVGPQGHPEHRAHRRPPEGSEHRLRRRARAPVRAESRARPVQDDRRRQDLDEHEVHRQRHRLHRRRDGSVESRTCSIAASYQRRRTPWGFNGGGPGSGLWKTTDGGKTWTKLTGNGLPDNPIIGRIGLDIARSKPATIYASIEVGPSGGTGAGVNDDGTLVPPGQGRGGGGGGGGARSERLPRPIRRRAASGDRTTAARRGGSCRTRAIAGCTTARSASIPTNPEIAYQGGAPFFKTVDGGKTWQQVQGIPHSDHHAIWIDPKNGNHILLGNDGGLDVTYDQAETWEYVNTVPVGQFYAVSADMRKPYYVCGGLQDNGSWCGPSATRSANGILNSDWFRVGGGDGFYTANDPTRLDDPLLRVAGRRDQPRRPAQPAERSSIRPRGPQAAGGAATSRRPRAPNPDRSRRCRAVRRSRRQPERQHRADAAARHELPVLLEHAVHPLAAQPAHDLSRRRSAVPSYNRGDTWMASPDLTKNIGRNDRPIMGVDGKAPMASKHDGAASYSNIVTISESPVVPGVIWVGTNDGNVQVSRDGGATWKNVVDKVPGVPKETHVSRVEPSHFDAGTALRDLRRPSHRRSQGRTSS